MEDIEMKKLAGDIELGLRRLGPDRVVALSVHKTKELIAELQEKATLLVGKLEKQG